MKHDTPLIEVAHHLPAATASFLGTCNSVVQEVVLGSVRTFVTEIEARGVALDTLAYDAVIEVYVAGQIAIAREATELHYRLQQAYQLSQEIGAMTRMGPS